MHTNNTHTHAYLGEHFFAERGEVGEDGGGGVAVEVEGAVVDGVAAAGHEEVGGQVQSLFRSKVGVGRGGVERCVRGCVGWCEGCNKGPAEGELVVVPSHAPSTNVSTTHEHTQHTPAHGLTLTSSQRATRPSPPCSIVCPRFRPSHRAANAVPRVTCRERERGESERERERGERGEGEGR